MNPRAALDRAGVDGAKTWFRIVNAAEQAEIYLYDEIGAWGIGAGEFAKELGEVKASTIDLRINSPGGEVFEGLAIFNALQRHPAKITVHVDGLAGSVASVIAMAGEKILIDRYAQMMIHEAHAIAVGATKDMAAMAKLLDEYSDNIAAIYAARAGGEASMWRERMKAETWFSAKEAVTAGLADEIAADAKTRPANTWDLSIFNFAGRDKAPDPFAPTPEPAALPPQTVEAKLDPVLYAFDPSLFRDLMAAAASDPAAPPPVPQRPVDLGPPVAPAPAPVNPEPIGLEDLFRAAMGLAANDAPAPPQPEPDDPADEPGFLMNAPAFRAAIKEAVSE